MPLLDRSPGAFIALANLVVYGVVCVEIWMWTAASVAAVAVTLTLIAVCAGLICRAVLHLMDDGVTTAEPTASRIAVPSRAAPTADAPTAATARPRPRPAGHVAHQA